MPPHLRRRLVAMLLVSATLSEFGCAYTSVARDRFSERYACPIDRIEVYRRGDVDSRSFLCSDARADVDPMCAPPPADVAADPARLEIYRRHQDDLRERWTEEDVYEVKGCGRDVLIGCHFESKHGRLCGEIGDASLAPNPPK